MTLVIVMAILLVNSVSLIFERKFYPMFYNSPYQRILEQTHAGRIKYGQKNIISIIESDKRKSKYYLEKQRLDSTFVWLERFKDKRAIIEFLRSQKTDYLSYGCVASANWDLPPIIQHYYPYLIEQQDYFNGNFYLFSKKPANSIPVSPCYNHAFGFETAHPAWQIKAEDISDSIAHTGKYALSMKETVEFGPVFGEKLRNIINHKNDYVEVSCWVFSKVSLKDVKLVVSLKSGENMILWTAVNLEDFQVEQNSWFKVYCTIKLAGTKLTKKQC
jgi:hypothetical protein